ncbi:YadA-like family protein [Veillonella atypica]|uniref:YadA-like family protein n=3 Tax=Veillonella TaxID=29465 RepID=UPI00248FCC05|nr:YadA-like family protein [Veillonella atypica]
MNKIFKVIWSKSKQCYVVVSELAKNTTGKKKIVVAGIFSALAIVQFGQVAQVQADGAIGSSTHKGSLAINGTWKAGYSNAKATDENAIAIGQDAQATGRGGVALGNETRSVQNALAAAWDAQATSKNAVALGTGTRAMGLSSTAVGAGSQATSNNSVAVGTGTRATGLSSTAVGDGAQATANGAVALGQATESAGNSVAAGFNAKARSNNTVAIGVEANNDGSITNNASSVSVGVATRARAVGSMAMGVSADASGKYSLALGSGDVGTDYTAGTNYPSASGEKSIAIGYKSNASDLNALAIGTGASVDKQNATAVGSGASVTGHNATAVGNDTKAIKQYDNAFGYTSTASGGAATAVGYLATASGNQTVALGSTINSTAQYATGIGYSVNSQGEGSVAIGAGTDALGAIPAKQVKATAKNAIAIGRATQATSQDATAIGTEATASNTDAIAIGRKSNASGSTSIGFGYNTKASDTNTVAIGTDVSATAESAIALGRKTTASGLSSTAVGPIANASGKYSSAFGMSATTSEENALALGTSANATRKNSVSLGSNSSTVNAATSESSVTFGNKNITWTAGVLSGTNLDGMQVSVGATGAERQIKNVAAGKISATSTDAINGAQLYAVAEGLRTKYVSINSTISNNQNNDGATGSDSVAIGPDAAATKPDSVAMGRSVKANGQQSIAVGKSAEAKQDYNVAIGSEVVANGNNSVAMGRYASSTGTAALAIGAYGNNKSTASGNYSIAIGRDVTASGVDSIATGRDSKATAEKALAYGANAQALATNSIAIGADSQANVDKGIAIGASSKANVASGVAGYNPNTEIIVRTDTYAPTAANTWSGTWGAVSVGDGTNTRQITGVAAGKADTDAVNVAQLKSVNLAFTGNSGSGDVNLSKSKLAVEGGTNSFITTTAANKKLEINTTQGTLKNTSGTVSVNGANGLAVAQNVADVINQANADQTIKYKANGTGNNSVKLSDGLNFTNGITTTATVGANGQVTFDLNTATQKSITDSATAVARTISLGGDTGITTAKSLSSANVNFGIKSGSPTYLTTVANGNDVTLTINEQAIKNAAKDASSFKVKANSTAAEDVKGGDTVVFNNGDNIAITQTGKTFKIATAPNVKFDTAIIGTNTTIGSTGITTNKVTVGNVSIDGTNGINAGNKAITNVGTGIVANSNADNSNVANIGDVKTIANDAVANLSTSLGVTDGTNSGTVNLKNQSLKVVGTGVAKATVSGQTITVDVAKGTLTNNTTTGALTGTAGVVDANDMAAAVNTAITKAVDTATGTQKLDISAGGTDSSVNLKNQKLTVAGTGAATASLNNQTITVDVAQGTFTNKSDGTTSATAGVAKATDVAAAINNTNTVLNQKIADATTSLGTLGNNTFTLKADSTDTTAQNLNKSGGLAFKVAGDGDLVSTSATTDAVKVTVKKGTLSTNTDGTINKAADGVVTADNMTTVVNDAITKAVTSAKDGSAWNISTNGGTATKVSGGNTVDLINGDNIEITQDGTDGKKITVKTKKDLTLDSVTAANTVKVGSGTNLITLDGATGGVSGNTFTAGNASMNTTGFRLTGGPSVTTTGIDAGNKVITNVASGGTTATNAANIGDITKAISDLTTNLTKNTSISYTANTTTPGQTVSLKDGFNFSNGTLTTAEVAANGVVKFNVTQGSLSTDGNGNITNTAGVATTDDVKNAVNTAINKAVTNSSAAVNTLGANTFTLKADSTDTTAQALNKSGGLAFKVAGDGDLVSTSATTDTVKVTVKKGTLTTDSNGNITNTTGVATTDDVKNAVTSAINTAVTKATGAQVLNITDGNNNGSINLKNDALKVVGTDGVTTEVSGKTITVGLDTATKNKINNASAATNKNISLAADTGNASSQSLKDGDVSFAVKGATGDYISTNMNGSTVEISTKRATIDSNAATGEASVTGNDGLATAKNVAAAINAATAKAVSQSAWKLSADNGATTETISGGDTVNFKAGSNMEVIRTGKDITYKTKDNVAFTTVTAGTGANEVKLDGNTGTVTAKDITATGDVNAKNVTTSGNVTAAGTVKGDTVQGNTVKAGNVTITGGTTNTITGLSNTTWNGSTTTPDRAATEGQLQQAISSAASSATFKFDGDNSSQQTMNLQNGTFKVTGDTMITTNATSAGIGLSLNTNNVKIAYAANGTNGQTTSLASGFNFSDGDHTKATVDSSGVVKYNAKTSTISVANGHAAASGNDLATADNVADAINQMTQNNAGNTAQLRQEISKVATETQRVGAHAAAMAALKPIQYDPLAPTQIMAGVGNYRGESAAALGIAHYTNDNTMFNVGVSVGGNHNMINAGVTHKFGISAEKKNIPDRYKAGPISSIYVMQDEMTQLRSENEAYKAKLDKQQSEIDALKAAVDQLLASKA